MKDRCENCRFWKPEDFLDRVEDPAYGIGLCTRYPPVISTPEGLEYHFEDDIRGKEASFPVTPHNLSCGEHRPKEK